MSEGRVELLLVAGDPRVATRIRELLAAAGDASWSLELSSSSAAARRRLAGGDIDLALVHLAPPDPGGSEPLAEILQAAAGAAVVVLAENGDEEAGSRMVRAGAQDLLAMDRLTGRELARAIRYSLARRRREAEGRRVESARAEGRRQAAEDELLREHEARVAAEAGTRAREEIMGAVAHDLRNPLSAIRMYAHLLHERVSGDAVRMTEAIDELTLQADLLIQDLLDFAAIEGGGLRLRATTCDCGDIVHRAADAMQRPASAKGITLSTRVPSPAPAVEADPDRIHQVLVNLLGNAVKFTPSGGSVLVSAAVEGAEVTFSVTDTGPGISEENRERIFDRFWQAASGTTEGAGLGLSIARGIVEGHGGTLALATEVGRGSTFSFALPLVAPAPAASPGRPAPTPETPRAAGPARARCIRVLLADDHSAIRRGVAEILRHSRGIALVGQAATGPEALDLARELRPDVVLMDLEMPEMGGIETTRRIREELPEVRVLALTADSPRHSLLPLLGAGGQGFIRKSEAHSQLVPALLRARRGELVVPAGCEELVRQAFHGRWPEPGESPLQDLQPRDLEILLLSAEGYTSAEIGKRVFLSKTTVDGYRSRLQRRLGVRNRSELTRWALRHGLLATPSMR